MNMINNLVVLLHCQAYLFGTGDVVSSKLEKYPEVVTFTNNLSRIPTKDIVVSCSSNWKIKVSKLFDVALFASF